MNNLKITTNYVDGRLANVVLNGEDISNKITGLTLEMKGGKIPKASIEFPLSEIEVDGDFEALKKIPQEKCEENGTEIIINGSKVGKCINPEDIAKAILVKIKEQSSYR